MAIFHTILGYIARELGRKSREEEETDKISLTHPST